MIRSVEHEYLWLTLKAFGLGPGFINSVKVLYCDIQSVLKISGGLSTPFQVQRGVRQGCALSGMLYSLAIELLLHRLRLDLQGLTIPGCAAPLNCQHMQMMWSSWWITRRTLTFWLRMSPSLVEYLRQRLTGTKVKPSVLAYWKRSSGCQGG